jgi:sarcosine oxidase
MDRYDAIIVGTGGIGSAALFQLARRGLRVLGIDRFPPAHDRGSSHGQTRMIRQAYFEHPDYVPLVLRAYALWAELEALCDRKLYHQVGLLQVGPADGQIVPGVLASAARHGLPIERLSPGEVERRWPGFRVPQAAEESPREIVGLFEHRAGYLRVEDCVQAHLDLAVRQGARLLTGVTVQGWRAEGGHVEVDSDGGAFAADRLVIAAGPWSGQVLRDLGIPLRVLRKAQYWFPATDPAYDARGGCPAFLFDTAAGLFYGFPRIDDLGVKVAEHSGGVVVADPLTLDRQVDPADRDRVAAFAHVQLPGLARRMAHHAACLYTMTPDGHFVVDRHPACPNVVFAAGLSGHGFKFAPVLGQALAEMALDGATELPIGFLGSRRSIP